MANIEKANFADKVNQLAEFWSPAIIGEVNDTLIKIAKIKGEFDMHLHEEEDEAFIVLKGVLEMRFENDDPIILHPGEMVVVPKGVLHQPVAEEEVHIILVEPSSTLNTGNLVNEKTKRVLDRI